MVRPFLAVARLTELLGLTLDSQAIENCADSEKLMLYDPGRSIVGDEKERSTIA